MDAKTSDLAPQRGRFAATYVLILLVIANVINYADRALLGIVVEPIRKELLLSDTQISIVTGFAFSLFFCRDPAGSRSRFSGSRSGRPRPQPPATPPISDRSPCAGCSSE